MIVQILDLDWLYDRSDLPNYQCMKLSSFHKQRKDTVFFVGDLTDLKYQYDKLYIFSNSESTPSPGAQVLNDKRTTLIGKKFELCGGKQLGAVILACRPDYTLYNITNEKSNSYNKANFITLFASNGTLITKRQEWHNTKKGVKRTIVTDPDIWTHIPEEVEKCLNILLTEKNIVFLEPISLKYLIENDNVRRVFCKLHFSRGTKFKWKNDMGSDDIAAKHIIDFIIEFRQNTKSDTGSIPIKASLDGETVMESAIRLFKTIYIFKQNKCRCFIPIAAEQTSPLILSIAKWCEYNIERSYIEEMIFISSARKGERWYKILHDPNSWGHRKVKMLVQLLCADEMQTMLPYLSLQWGADTLNYDMINLEQIKQKSYALM